MLHQTRFAQHVFTPPLTPTLPGFATMKAMRREVCLKGAWVDLFSNRMLSAAETSERQPFFKIRVFPCPRLRKDPTQLPATPLTEPAACSEHAAPESLHTLPVPRLLPHLGLTSGFRSISEGSIPEQRLSF